jgi:hypothetical protein
VALASAARPASGLLLYTHADNRNCLNSLDAADRDLRREFAVSKPWHAVLATDEDYHWARKKILPEHPDSDFSDRPKAADVLVREEPNDEEDEPKDDDNEEDDENDEDDAYWSERAQCLVSSLSLLCSETLPDLSQWL